MSPLSTQLTTRSSFSSCWLRRTRSSWLIDQKDSDGNVKHPASYWGCCNRNRKHLNQFVPKITQKKFNAFQEWSYPTNERKKDRNQFKVTSQVLTSTHNQTSRTRHLHPSARTIHRPGLNFLQMTMTFQCVNHQPIVSRLDFWSLVQTPFTGLLVTSRCVDNTPLSLLH